MPDSSALLSTKSFPVHDQNLWLRLGEIPWKKSFRQQILPLLEHPAENISELAECLLAPLLPVFRWKTAEGEPLWQQQAESLLALLTDREAVVHEVGFSEEFPLYPSAVESARELLQRAVKSVPKKGPVPRRLTDQLELFLAEEQEIFLAEIPAPLTTLLALRTLCLAHVFCLLAPRLPDAQQVQVWELLYQRAKLVGRLVEYPRDAAESSVVSLLLRGELCCLLGLLFAEVPGLPDLYRSSRKALAAELDAHTDSDGTPHQSWLPQLPDWLSIFLRQQQLAQAAERKFFSAATNQRWEDFLQRLASLTTTEGQLVLSGRSGRLWASHLFRALIQIPGWKKQAWIVQTVQSLRAGNAPPLKVSRKVALAEDETAATQTDWGYLACLRNNWYPGADLLAVEYEQPNMQLQMSLLASPFLQGNWQTEVNRNGHVVSLQNHWSALCWYNQAACDYLELRLETAGLTIDRQLFLSRTDHFAILADTLKVETEDRAAANNTPISLRWDLPLADGWEKKELPPGSGRELVLQQRRKQVRLLPLSLPQDHLIRPAGQFQWHAERLSLTLQGEQNLCQALLLDWSPERQRNFCDWTALTITQERQILSPRQAFAARARIGKHQWLFLRNLEHSGLPRAVLGMHCDAESVIAEVQATGQTERLVEVHYETDDE